MNWTTEKPTVPGWYWWREPKAKDNYRSIIHWDAESKFVIIDGCRHSKDSFHGSQFAGPIPEPGTMPFTPEEIYAALNEAVYSDRVTLAADLLARAERTNRHEATAPAHIDPEAKLRDLDRSLADEARLNSIRYDL